MQLFKRMILSLFPEDMVNNPVNPASMFVGFISAKQYFSVITRRIVENYKLNLFDISLDPFEVKIGFGDNPTIKVKDVDFYYGYAAAANLNGYRSFAPGQAAHSIALLAATYCEKISSEYEEFYTTNFVYSVYLMTFIFQGKIKQFPEKIDGATTKNSKEKNFARFLQVFFSFYEFLLEQTGRSFSKDTIEKIKSELLKEHIELFFLLQYFYQFAGESLSIEGITKQQFFGWLLYDELQAGELQAIAQDFLAHSEETVYKTTFSTSEKNIIPQLFPADILVKYIIDAPDVYATIHHMIKQFFPREKIKPYMTSFLTGPEKFLEFLQLITDYTYFKETFFTALKKYITHTFQRKDAFDVQQSKEIDEWMSTISNADGGPIDMLKVPERIKQESEAMERLMNFYVTFVGGSWLGRGDSWYVRGLYPKLLADLHKQLTTTSRSDGSYYYTGLLQNYSRNIFYYKYAFENIRAGKEKFHLPFRATFREVYSNICIVKLFETSFLSILLQDILPKDIKLYTKNKKILDLFATHFQTKIHQLTKKKPVDIVSTVYGPYNSVFHNLRYDQTLLEQDNLQLSDFTTELKENAYTLDFRLQQEFIEKIAPYAKKLQDVYSDASIVGIFALLRETLLGFLLYYTYLQTNTGKIHNVELLISFYVVDVLVVSEEFVPIFTSILSGMVITYIDILQTIHEIDDNTNYFKIAKENRKIFAAKKTPEEIIGGLSGEDIIWFRGFLKSITYYNKRFIAP